jgi:hypothetical protein
VQHVSVPGRPWRDIDAVVADDVFALGVFSSLDSIAAKVFTTFASDQDEGVNFAVTTEKSVMTKLALTADTIVILKNFDDLRADLPVSDPPVTDAL